MVAQHDQSIDRYLQNVQAPDSGKMDSKSSGDGPRRRMPQNTLQILLHRSQNAKSVMAVQEQTAATAASLTHSIPQGSGENAANKIVTNNTNNTNNTKLSFASPHAEVTRLKQTKTISASRGACALAPGDVVLQMSSPQPKNGIGHSDQKVEGDNAAIQILE